MRALITCLLIAFLFALPARAADRATFAHEQITRDADQYEAFIVKNWAGRKGTVDGFLKAGDGLIGKDARAASRSYAAAVGSDPKLARAWLGLARALNDMAKGELTGQERYNVPVNASGSAFRAYQLATSPAAKAEALTVLAHALELRSFWRPALEALKASLALKENATVRATYDRLRTAHGFRMTDYSTETNATPPRLCLQFSEPLSKSTTDFTPFVAIGGRDPQSLEAEGNQLCVEGLEHGQRYEIQLKAGLPSDIGESLEKPVEIAAYVPDRKPFVHFAGRAYVLPSRGQQGIPVVSVNTDAVDVEVYRVGDRSLSTLIANGDLERPLSTWDVETLRDRTGEKVYSGTLDVKKVLNADVTTAFPVSDAIGTLKPGAYVMTAKAATPTSEDAYQVATQWFIVSDLGLTAFSGEGGIDAFVRSLAAAEPVADVEVRLLARNNEVLATTRTDAKGHVRFDAALTRGEGGLAPAVLIAQGGDTDYAFLDLTAAAFDLTDRGVKGREVAGPIDSFLYTERGVYRPGEAVNFTALVRDAAGRASSLPVTLIVTRPDGVEHRRVALTADQLGGRTTPLSLSGGAMTGTWRAKVHVDPAEDAIAETAFLVEDFVPERLDLKLEAETPVLKVGETATIAAAGKYLYGPPAAGLSTEAEIIVRAAAGGLSDLPGYQFGQYDEEISPVREAIAETPETGDDGKAQLEVELPSIPETAKPLEAQVLVRLAEPGGRTIERSVVLPVDPDKPRIGVKPLFTASSLGEGQPAAFNVVLLGADGKQASADALTWELKRLDTRWQWYSRDGSWAYDAVTTKSTTASGKIALTAGTPATVTAPVEYGRYVLEVAAAGEDGPVSSVAFTAGWYQSGTQADSPEVLDVALDSKSYKPGETAKLRIASREGGTALVAVIAADGLKTYTEATIGKGGGDVAITVGDDWGPGAYATAVLYRPMDENLKRMPQRSLGVAWIGMDQAARTLSVTVSAAEKIKSGTELVVPVKVGGLEPGEAARITVAAVDVGILNLTNFKTPAPEAWFNAQTRLSAEIRDFYGRLIDGMRAERGSLRSGGDGDAGLQIEGSPPVEATVAEFSGIVEVGADGTAEVAFALPDFNGTVRIMAVAWSKAKTGHGVQDVIVRDRLALIASAPRFMTLGDEAMLGVDLHNIEGPAGSYAISVSEDEAAAGAGKSLLGRDVALAAGERKRERVALKPSRVGRQSYLVRVTGPEGIDVKRQLTFDVKPPAGGVKRTSVIALAPGANLTLSPDLVSDLIAERTELNVSVGPAARFDVPGLIAQLDRYPYGCAEQTVSRALPLVYASALAARSGVTMEAGVKERVQKAVDRVLEMQDSSGAFGAWGPSYTNIWLTAFVTDFLSRAREAGYRVDPQPFDQALDRLANFIAYAQDFQAGGEDRAYALYVLARNGRAPAGELRYYTDARLDRFSSALAKAQVGAALAMIGDKDRAERAFGAAVAQLSREETAANEAYDLARSDYGTWLRDGAALVALSAEAGLVETPRARLIDAVAKGYLSKRYTSTQEQAWLLLAVNALSGETQKTGLTVDGVRHDGPLVRAFTAQSLDAGDIKIRNDGESSVDAVVSVIGASLTPEPAAANGFLIERAYYTLAGEKVDLASATGGASRVAQNDRLVTVVTVKTQNAGGRLLVVDRLPAGFEIENPRLVGSGDVSTLSWLKSDVAPEHAEFRDDRMAAAFNLFGDGSEVMKPAGTRLEIAYVIRAVTPGSFVHPAATVEDMYVPERHARTAAGRLSVIADGK
ncbi:MAG: alpha-2-macroglobulin [Hyphomicrobiaceae bacterium]|nr:alpha-2-macroglobulin [Hyphomicrobiaceae bacterium]